MEQTTEQGMDIPVPILSCSSKPETLDCYSHPAEIMHAEDDSFQTQDQSTSRGPPSSTGPMYQGSDGMGPHNSGGPVPLHQEIEDQAKLELGLSAASPSGLNAGGDAVQPNEVVGGRGVELLNAFLAGLNESKKQDWMQWTQDFMELEQLEVLNSSHVDKLLVDAKALEQNLIQQKEKLMSHLGLLSQTLKL